MFDLPAFVSENEPWKHLLTLVAENRSPQSLALSAPSICHGSLVSSYAQSLLCSAGTGDDGCLACAAWASGAHPDLLLCGEEGSPPGIDDCRRLWGDLSLCPVVAPWRLGVVFAADHLSLPAANSLLKMTEEPPQRARLLFLLDDGELIPTLRSRCWNLSLAPTEREGAEPPPQSVQQWAQSFSESKSGGQDALIRLRRWTSSLLERGDVDLACSLESVRLFAERTRLSESMLQDLTYLVLKEDLSLEQIFSDFW